MPFASTVATFALLLVHLISFIVALSGLKAALKVASEPLSLIINVLWSRLTLVTA